MKVSILVVLLVIATPIVSSFHQPSQESSRTFSFQFGKVFYQTADWVTVPEFIGDYSVQLFNDTTGSSRFNLNGTLLTELAKVAVITTYAGKHNQKDKEFNKVFFNGTFDTCDVENAMKTNFILKTVVENLEEYSNYRFKCPQKAGIYHLTNFPAFSDQYMPHHLLGTLGLWKLTVCATAQIKLSGPMVHIFTLNIYGSNV